MGCSLQSNSPDRRHVELIEFKLEKFRLIFSIWAPVSNVFSVRMVFKSNFEASLQRKSVISIEHMASAVLRREELLYVLFKNILFVFTDKFSPSTKLYSFQKLSFKFITKILKCCKF